MIKVEREENREGKGGEARWKRKRGTETERAIGMQDGVGKDD